MDARELGTQRYYKARKRTLIFVTRFQLLHLFFDGARIQLVRLCFLVIVVVLFRIAFLLELPPRNEKADVAQDGARNRKIENVVTELIVVVHPTTSSVTAAVVPQRAAQIDDESQQQGTDTQANVKSNLVHAKAERFVFFVNAPGERVKQSCVSARKFTYLTMTFATRGPAPYTQKTATKTRKMKGPKYEQFSGSHLSSWAWKT